MRCRLLSWIAVLVTALLLTSCSSGFFGARSPTQSGCGRPRGLVLIIGAHRNAPEPVLDGRLLCQLTAAIDAGQHVQIVIASGDPQLRPVNLIPVHSGTLAQQNSPHAEEEDLGRVRAAIAAARPLSPGVDDLAALSVAADAARSDGTPHAELVLVDSGLDDRGVLDFTVPGISPSPAEVAAQLRASHELPACGDSQSAGESRLHGGSAGSAVRQMARQRNRYLGRRRQAGRRPEWK